MRHLADSRDAAGQMALFTEDAHFVVFMDSKVAEPSQELRSRAELAPVFDYLNTYHATRHFNSQSTVELHGDRATGLTYCMAHYLALADGKQQLIVAAIRYRDTFTKMAGQWLFAERQRLAKTATPRWITVHQLINPFIASMLCPTTSQASRSFPAWSAPPARS